MCLSLNPSFVSKWLNEHQLILYVLCIKWFSLAALKIVQGKMKLPKQTQKFMDRHQDDVRKLASAIVDPEVKCSIILKPGGGGFFGGVIIRSMIRWDGNKLMRKFNKKTNQNLRKRL